MLRTQYMGILCLLSLLLCSMVGCENGDTKSETSPPVGYFFYRLTDQCYFKGSVVDVQIFQTRRLSGLNQGIIRIERPDGLPMINQSDDAPFPYVVPAQIVKIHLSRDYIFGETRILGEQEEAEEESEKKTHKNIHYNGWFFLDIPQRICYQILTEKKYQEILDKYEIPEKERILTDPMQQDRSKWSQTWKLPERRLDPNEFHFP